MIQTIFVYTFLAFFMFYFTKKADMCSGTIANVFFCTPVLLYTIVFGVRYGVGIDYLSYLETYENWGVGSAEEERMELGFALINQICSVFSFSPVVLFSIFAFLQIIFIYCVLKDKKEVLAYSVLMLIVLGTGLWNFQNGIRQAIAFSVFFFSLTFIVNKKLILYAVTIIFATFFHKSAIVLLPIYFLFNRGQLFFKSVYFQFIMLFVSALLSVFGIGQMVFGKFESIIVLLGYEQYLGSSLFETFSSGWTLYTFVLLLVYFIFAYQYPKVRDFYQNDRLFEIVYDLFFIGTCLNYIFLGNMMFGRILSYFTNFGFIIFGYYLNYYVHSYKRSYFNLFSYLYIIVYLILFYGYVVLYNSYNNCIQYATYYQTHLYDRQERMLYDNKVNRF